jgi:AraC-like DNA-binding protein
VSIYREFTPAAVLQPYIECYWTREAAVTPVEHRVLPDGCIDLLIEEAEGQSRAIVVGTMTKAILVNGGPTRFSGVRFKPGGAHAFFELPMSALTNATVNIDELWLDGFPVVNSDRIDALEQQLLSRLPKVRHLDRTLGAAVSIIQGRLGQVRIDQLSTELGVSRQHLTRIFDERVGISAKTFSRVIRLQSLVRRLDGIDHVDWASAAYDSGYYDQAHMIGEFQEFVGVSPTMFHSSNT